MGSNLSSERGALAGLLVLGVFTAGVSACGVILGIEPGALLDDGGVTLDVNAPLTDAGTVTPEGSVFGPCTAGKEDPSYCQTHCGTSQDDCGNTYKCPAACSRNIDVCNQQTHVCECKDENFCQGRCGTLKNNCGVEVTCPSACTCNADHQCTDCKPAATDPCAGKTCGLEANGTCAQKSCSGESSGACRNSTERCYNGNCCTPKTAADLCGSMCSGQVDDRCGNKLDCPNYCTSPQVCAGDRCCKPSGYECNPNSLINECCTSCVAKSGVASDSFRAAIPDGGATLDSGTVTTYICQ